MAIEDIPKEIVVLAYFDANGSRKISTKNIKEDLGRSYVNAFGRLSYKFGCEINAVGKAFRSRGYIYSINDKGRADLESWIESHKDIASELNGIYIAKFIETNI
ncbi:MAG: hypothetical protein KJ906_01335 [Nanoarchaeota archaeon]|nr:hypothetical protein [Nanoarchaeota archaeon]